MIANRQRLTPSPPAVDPQEPLDVRTLGISTHAILAGREQHDAV